MRPIEFARGLVRNFRDGGAASGLGFLRSSEIRKSLHRVPDFAEQGPCEIHVLLGSDRVDMGLWMVASWLLATKRRWDVVFHDDGTLSRPDQRLLLKAMPDARVIMSDESCGKLEQHLRAYPLSWRCRNIHPLSRKLFDVPFFCRGTHFISIDTDVLFHGYPHELLEWADNPKARTLFMQDVKDCTLPQAREAGDLLGCNVTGSINTGIIAIGSQTLSLDVIEQCLAKTRMFEADPWYIEQSLYGVLASYSRGVELLDPNTYEIPVGKPFNEAAIATHYIGAIRHHIYSRGMSKVARFLA